MFRFKHFYKVNQNETPPTMNTQPPAATATATATAAVFNKASSHHVYLAFMLLLLLISFPSPALNNSFSPIMRTITSPIEVNADISLNRLRASALFRAVTGVGLAIDDPRLAQMEVYLVAGDGRRALEIAVQDPYFFDVQIRDFARQMSTREESRRVTLNDFTAMIVGIARDGLDARDILSGNYFYHADPNKTIIDGTQRLTKTSVADHVIKSNDQFAEIEGKGLSLASILIREDGQKIANSSGDIVPNPDPAGVLTSRAFMGAHGIAGTNRRLVEYTFREFMCVEMKDWMDAGRPDDFVGRDVDRFPGGSHAKYETNCKACHSQMDAFRGAFAYYDFTNGRVTYTPLNPAGKYFRNNDMFPQGYSHSNDSWVNYATEGKNSVQFGWRDNFTGNGVYQFGKMIANSRGFSRCMTKRMFASICKRNPSSEDAAAIESITNQFEKTYKLTELAMYVAANSACL